MKTTLEFFDNNDSSLKGIRRGIIILIIYIIVTYAWYYLMMKFYMKSMDKVRKMKILIATIVAGLLVSSAVTVSISPDYETALVYGLLVGLVIYGFKNIMLLIINKRWNYYISLIDILYGIVATMFLSWVSFELMDTWPDTFRPLD